MRFPNINTDELYSATDIAKNSIFEIKTLDDIYKEGEDKFKTGQYGHIMLAKPVFNLKYTDTLVKALKCICYKCSSLISNKKCINKKCDAIQPLTIFRDSTHTMIKMEWSDKQIELYDAESIKLIIDKILDDDMKIIGFSETFNPKYMIYTALPLILPETSASKDSKHALTYKLCDIVKTNDILKDKLSKSDISSDNIVTWTKLLQYHITTFINNSVPEIPKSRLKDGKAVSSLFDQQDFDLSF